MILCISESTDFRIEYKKLSAELQPVLWDEVNILSTTSTVKCRVQIEIFSQVAECCNSTYPHLVGESKAKILAHMDMLLHVVRQRGKRSVDRRLVTSKWSSSVSTEFVSCTG